MNASRRFNLVRNRTLNGQEKTSLLTFSIALTTSVLFLLYMVGSFIIALIMGGILAILARPLYRRLIQKAVRPSLAAGIVTLLIVVVVVGPLLAFSSLAVKQGIAVAQVVTEGEVINWPEFLSYFQKWSIVRSEWFGDSLKQSLEAAGAATSTFVLSIAKSIPDAMLQIVLACLGCYFLLIDGHRFLAWVYARIPLATDVRRRLTEVFQSTAISVIWASMAAAGTQALIIFLGFLILKVPAAFLAGGVTFIFAFIPLLGSFPISLAGIIYLVAEGSFWKAIIMVGVGVFTAIIDNFVRPWVLKGRGEMHPLVSLVAIFGGIQTFGIFGVFLGPILTALVITLLQIWPLVGRRYGLDFADIDEVLPSRPR